MSELEKINLSTFDTIKEGMLKLVDEQTFLREASFATQAVNNSDALKKCTWASLFAAVYNTATTGLTLNPVMKYAALVPRYNSKQGGNVAVLEPMYQGLVKLITDTGSVETIYAHLVYNGDEFEVSYGTTAEVIHKPKFKSKQIEYAYAVAILPGGTKQFEVMSIEELHAIREKSESYKSYKSGRAQSCIWVDHEGEMCRKTVIKRLAKYVPKTDKWEKAAATIDLDNSDYTVSDSQTDYLLSLLNTSTYGKDETGAMLEAKINAGLTHAEFNTLLSDLKANQLDPITHGGNYNQGDISAHVKKVTGEYTQGKLLT